MKKLFTKGLHQGNEMYGMFMMKEYAKYVKISRIFGSCVVCGIGLQILNR